MTHLNDVTFNPFYSVKSIIKVKDDKHIFFTYITKNIRI